MIVLPLLVLPGKDAFRLPKTMFLRAIAIALVATWLITSDRSRWERIREAVLEQKVLLLPILVLVWASVSAAFATSPVAARNATINIAAAGVFATALFLFMPPRKTSLYALLFPSLINAVSVMVQESGLWHPFADGLTAHMANGALLGNPNDVGAFLAAPALVSLAMIRHEHGLKRLIAAVVAVILVGGIAATQTLTALLALIAGVVTFVLLIPRRRWIWVAMMVGLLAAASFAPPMRERIGRAFFLAETGDWNVAFTGRLSPFLAALEMFRERPIAGVGPGCFATEYLPYRFRADLRHPDLTRWPSALGSAPSFGEAHNDHLQILAELGIPGYLLFLWALVAIASASAIRQTPAGGERARDQALGRSLGLPLAVLIGVLTAAQFPLQIAGPAAALIFTAVAVLRLSRMEAGAASTRGSS